MNNFILRKVTIRKATINDVPFLVDTIIEAEKSGTDKLSYSTIFGLSEDEVRKYLIDILNEEVDGCELSISSFLIAEYKGKIGGAISAWIEGIDEVSSAVIKGNLLNYTLPKECIERAINLNEIIRELRIEYIPNTIVLGVGYVVEEFRGNKLLGLLNSEIIARLIKKKPDVTSICAQIFSCNTPSLRAMERTNYNIVMTKTSSNYEINKFLPSNTKYFLKKIIKQ